MAIFTDPQSSTQMVVDVGRFHVWVQRIKGVAQWQHWYPDGRLKVLSIFKGSTFGGPSYATLQLAVGQPFDQDADYLEDVPALYPGDRVAIGNGPAGDIKWLFCGYCTQGQLEIRDGHESLVYRVAGPEWFWGIGQGTGADEVIYGQARRKSAFDDDWMTSPANTITPYAGWDIWSDERAVFNPNGQRNMTQHDVRLNATNPPLLGRIWEIPDRKRLGSIICEHWTMLQAVKTLMVCFNDEVAGGILNPTDWEGTGLPDERIGSIDVDGMSLWDAVNKIIAPGYGIYVEPAPLKAPNRDSWGPFRIGFYARGSGPEAKLYLNELNTPMHRAVKCVARLNVSKDIAKTVNQVKVLGKALRGVRLWYYGSLTPTLTDDQEKIALQHGWPTSSGDLNEFATAGVIDEITIQSKGSTIETKWRDRHTTGGALFPVYGHVFRMFIWNEAGEWSGSGPMYGTANHDWFAPDLDGIADDTGLAAVPNGLWYRRRRPLLDTQYFDGGIDAWRRIRPIVYIAAVSETDDNTIGPWKRLSPGKYRIDNERAAIWITAEDLGKWKPFVDEENPAEATISDGRTFATLLLTGKLRMMVEASVETDYALDATAERQATSGSPLVRSAVFREPASYVKSAAYDDGATSPSGLSANLADTSEDAMAFAAQTRAAGQDMQPHASILVELDWPEIPIGAVINRIEGRGDGIELRGGLGGTGVGAQVVAKIIDPNAMKWEYLTQSAAMQLRDLDRARVLNRRRVKGQAASFPIVDTRTEEENADE